MTTESSTPMEGMTPGASNRISEPDSVTGKDTTFPALTVLQREAYWLFVLIPYLVAWIMPFVWSGYRWYTPSYILFFQPFILVLTPLLIWYRRDWLVQRSRTGSSRNKKIAGQKNLLLFLLGVVALLFAYLVQIKGIAVLGLLLMGWGIAQFVYGWRLLKALWMPIVLSLLVVPIPDSIADGLLKVANTMTFRIAVPIFSLLKKKVSAEASKLDFPASGVSIDYNSTQSGMGILAASLVGVFYYCVIRRFDSLRTTLLLTFTAVLTVGVNLARVLLAGLFGGNPHLSGLLARNELLVLALGIIALLVAVLLEHWCYSLFQKRAGADARRRSDPGATLTAGVERLGRAGETVAAPLEQGVRQVGTLLKRSERGIEGAFRKIPSPKFNPFVLLGTAWKRSEQAIEAGLKKLFPRKKRRRRR